MKLTKTTGWSLGTTGLCVALVAGGWFGLIEPQRAQAAESRELTVSAEQGNMLLEAKIEELKEQFANLPAETAKLAAVRQALPAEPALAQLTRDLSTLSLQSQTTLDSLTTSSPVVVVDPAAAVAAPAPEEGTAESGDEAAPAPSTEPTPVPSDAAAADPGAAAAPAAVTPPPQPVLAAVPVTVSLTGDFASSTLMLKALQAEMPRAFLVDNLVLTVDESESSEAGTIRTVISGRVFVFVDPTEISVSDAVPSPTPSDG